MAKLDSVAIFADCGITAHQAQYRQAGTSVAQQDARVVCVGCGGQWPQAVVDSALGAGGSVTVMVGPAAQNPTLPSGVHIERFESDDEAAMGAVRASQAVIGLPGGIATMRTLYAAWAGAGGAACGRPVGLLNRDRAFEVVRGFLFDVAAPGRGNIDSLVQFSDNFDDLWNKLTRLV